MNLASKLNTLALKATILHYLKKGFIEDEIFVGNAIIGWKEESIPCGLCTRPKFLQTQNNYAGRKGGRMGLQGIYLYRVKEHDTKNKSVETFK